MKLTKSKLVETLRKLNNRKTVYQARKIADITVRRVYQAKEAFDRTGEIASRFNISCTVSPNRQIFYEELLEPVL